MWPEFSSKADHVQWHKDMLMQHLILKEILEKLISDRTNGEYEGEFHFPIPFLPLAFPFCLHLATPLQPFPFPSNLGSLPVTYLPPTCFCSASPSSDGPCNWQLSAIDRCHQSEIIPCILQAGRGEGCSSYTSLGVVLLLLERKGAMRVAGYSTEVWNNPKSTSPPATHQLLWPTALIPHAPSKHHVISEDSCNGVRILYMCGCPYPHGGSF